MRLCLALCISLLLATSATAADSSPAPAVAQKAVLVTGASTGIGRKITENLAADGYFVYATARKDADLAALGKIRNVQAIRMDVTRPDEVTAALAEVTKAGRGLWGIVNNAGVGTAFPAVPGNDAEFDLTMQVNVYGPYRVTKTFAPLVIAEKGRIVNIGSIAGLRAWRHGSAYTMSKHAVEAFTDALGAELESEGVQVAVVEPGNYNSQINKNAVERLKADPKRADRSMYKEPDEVAAAVKHALFDAAPRRRYMVVPNEQEARSVITTRVQQLVQLNESQAYSYGRDELIKMLDEALASAKPRAP